MTVPPPTPQFASLVYGPRGVPLDDPAELFHEASSLYPNLAPERLELLRELESGSDLVRTLARSSRKHDHRPGVDLPEAAPLERPLAEVLARRRSRRPEVLRPLELGDLGAVLQAAYAAGGRQHGLRLRPVPSAGALYPLELYVLAPAVRELEPALYHFDPFRSRLALLGPLDPAGVGAALVDGALAPGTAALLVVTGVFWRSRCKYGLRGYRFALLEAGHLMQNVVLAAASLDLQALPLGGFYDRRVDALVGADGVDEATVYAVALGGRA